MLHRRARRVRRGILAHRGDTQAQRKTFGICLGVLGDLGGKLPFFRLFPMSYNARVMIAKDLLEILVCPADKQPLAYREKSESLNCKPTHRAYAVKDDIPIMRTADAT